MSFNIYDLITDRTQADVAARNDKGSYNATDLNRVGEACEYVADRLNSLGGFDIHVTAKQDWTEEDIPTPSSFDSYLADISAIREAYAVIAPAVPADMEQFTYEEANDIEKILIAVDELLERVIATFVYSGQTYSGIVWEALT